MKTEDVIALQLFEKLIASESCGMCIWKSACLPSKNEGKGFLFVPFISNLVQLFDMEMFEVTVRLILKALFLALNKS